MNKKSVQKSIRISEEVFSYIDSFNGNGFNEKLCNLILYCMKEQKEIEKKIDFEKKSLVEYNKQIEQKRKILSSLNDIERYINYALKNVTQ